MPIRKGGANLWFKTQEEIDEYDDKMMAAIELTSLDFEDDNYAPVFTRAKKEVFLRANERAIRDANKIESLTSNRVQYIDKYLIGKRDNTPDRNWTFHRFGLGYGVSYLLVRELPIRNFYARCWIMIAFFCKVAQTTGRPFSFKSQFWALEDEWTNKEVRNFDVYEDNRYAVIPNQYNKLREQVVWKLNQPAYMRDTPEKYMAKFADVVFPPTKNIVAWDGTFNMPLQGLAHHLHIDAKYTDFITA